MGFARLSELQFVPLLRRWGHNGYLFTFVVQIFVLIGGLLTLRLAAEAFGNEGFGIYTVSRRSLSMISFPSLLGLGIGIPRYIGISLSSSRKNEYFLAALGIAALSSCGILILALLFPSRIGWLLFGSGDFSYMVFPIAVGVLGLNLYTLTYAYFRGHLSMWSANGIQIVSMAIAPLLSVFLSRGRVAMAVMLLGSSWLLISLAVLIPLVTRIWRGGSVEGPLWALGGELLRYGVVRVPGEFALFGLFSIPTLLVARIYGMEHAGFFSFGLSLLQLGGSMFATLGILLLPYLSNLYARQELERIRRIVRWVLVLSFVAVSLGVGVFELAAAQIVPLFMGEGFRSAVGSLRITMIGALPYVAYLILRNPLDAVAIRSYNSINLGVSLLLMVVLLIGGRSVVSPEWTVVIGMACLGGLSMASWGLVLRDSASRIGSHIRA